MTDDARAMAINDFFYLLSQGYPKQVAFERAVDGPTDAVLIIPSNVRVDVVMRIQSNQPPPVVDEGSGD